LVSVYKKIGTAAKNYHGFLENFDYSQCTVMIGHRIWVEIGGSISTSCRNRTRSNSFNSLQMLK
jgi:hypothetical protein